MIKKEAGKDISKVPFILILIGVILGGLAELSRVFSYFIIKYAKSEIPDAFATLGMDISIFTTWMLVSGLLGVLITIILIFYLIKIKNNPVKKSFIIITILSVAGIISGMSVGGLLILIGGIIGIVKT